MEMKPPAFDPAYVQRQDAEHLNILSILHYVMFTVPEDEKEGPTILLSANISSERVDGGDVNVLPPDVRAQFDMTSFGQAGNASKLMKSGKIK